ncbi:MAG: c-type cytochrome [Alphaproteobacteria bacterium]|nr:c-type cytochrome [Alphaproteobacteria bacterium]
MPRVAFGLAVTAALGVAGTAVVAADPQDFSRIERGRYLAEVGDCAPCHTRQPNGAAYGGGRAIETPFGTIVSANITPDRETGIGAWSDDDFVRAVQHGIRSDGSNLFPAMPYPYFARATREDILAIRAYVNTLPAVSNAVKTDQLPFPLSVRTEMVAWNKLYFHPAPVRPDPGKSDEWNRGAYLVEGLMHCGACHTPKNAAGADYDDAKLQGYALQGWFAPNLTDETRRGLGSWSTDDIVAYLKTGHNHFSAAAGPMAEMVANSSSKLTDADLRAVASYLKDQPAPKQEEAKRLAGSEAPMRLGAAIYADECSACHTPSGKGVPNLFPSLAGSAAVQQDDPSSLIRIVLGGMQSVATGAAPTGPEMPLFGWVLDDRQTAAVLTYIRNSWGNAAPAVSADEVGKARHRLAESTD